ncbi:MAG: hypothetical protein R2685_10805 [Candidatus Nitrosocosmicus sp.]|nr:hypothetical protein [Candidatus Nitrosocosmicus sp.]
MTDNPIPIISNPETTTTVRYGGDIILSIRDLLNDVDLSPLFEGWRPSIKTQFVFWSGKFAMYDEDHSNEVSIEFDDVSNHDGNVVLHIPPFTDDNDWVILKNHPDTINYKVLGTGITVADDIDFNSNAILEATISGASNTITNIDDDSLLQITDKTKLPDDTVYTTGAQTLQDKAIDTDDNNTILNIRNVNVATDAAITYSKLALTNSITNADIVSLAYSKLTSVPSSFTPSTHASSHGSGQSDEISIDWSQITTGIPTTFTPSTHATSHENGGSDELTIDWTQLANVPTEFTPSDHTHIPADISEGIGTEGQVLTVVSGVPAWADPTGGEPGAETLDDLTDVDTTTSPNDGDVLTYNSASSVWIPATPSGGGGGAADLDDLTDVTLITPADGDILQRQSGTFVNIALSTVDIDWSQLTSVPSTFTPAAHGSSHENGGTDELEIDWTQLANVPSTFTASAHAASHGNGGGDEISIDWSQITTGVPTTFTPSAHVHSWADITSGTPPAIDTLSAGTDITTLNANTTKHGLLPKLSGDANQYLNGSGTWSTPAGGEGGGSTSLAGLTDDVSIASPANGNILVYNSISTNWENEAQSILSISWEQLTGIPSTFSPSAHASSHGNGGSDEISIDWTQIITGKPTTFTPSAHAASHENGGGDELVIDWSQLASIPSTFTPSAHASTHNDGGSDELDLSDLAGQVSNSQISGLAYSKLTSVPSTFTPSAHASSHADGGTDEIAIAWGQITSGIPTSFTPSTHAASHADGGSDEISIAWGQITSGVPTSFTPSAHAISHAEGGTDEIDITGLGGFSGNSSEALRGDGTWGVVSGGGATALDDLTDVTITTPATNSVLKFDSSNWIDGFIDWAELTGKPSTFTPSLHASSHGNGQTDEISIDWSQITSGVPASFTPSAHTHAANDITSGQFTNADIADLAYSKLTGVPSTFTPSAHAASHGDGGGDEISIDWSQITSGIPSTFTPSAHNHAASDINSGTLAVARGGTGKTTFTQHALLKGGASNAYDEITVGSNDQVLAVVSGTPAWKSLDSERTGKALANGNGSTTVFNIAHGLGATPSYAFVDCSSHAIARTWTVDGTNITVTFTSAPSSGTNNVVIFWRVIAA